MDAPDLPDAYRRADIGALPLTVVLMTKPRRDKGFVALWRCSTRRRRPGLLPGTPEPNKRKCRQRRDREADGAETGLVVCDV
jgi:hypothetical protein